MDRRSATNKSTNKYGKPFLTISWHVNNNSIPWSWPWPWPWQPLLRISWHVNTKEKMFIFFLKKQKNCCLFGRSRIVQVPNNLRTVQVPSNFSTGRLKSMARDRRATCTHKLRGQYTIYIYMQRYSSQISLQSFNKPAVCKPHSFLLQTIHAYACTHATHMYIYLLLCW